MKNLLLILFISIAALKPSFAQKFFKPTSVGIIKEFSGVVLISTAYDYDFSFTLNDPKYGKIDLYFKNGRCFTGEDKYELEIDISEDLYNIFMSQDGWNRMKVKVTAKSTYGFECGNCDDCKTKKIIIWRPIKVNKMI